jgi:hypothetical protein
MFLPATAFEISKLRCLCSVTWLIIVFFIIRGGWKGLLIFLALEKIYLTFIRPMLEYADVVWDNKTLFLINKLENVQIEAAWIITGGTRLVSINSLYKETGWETLQARRENHKKIYDLRDEGDLLSLIDVGSLFHNLTVEGRK